MFVRLKNKFYILLLVVAGVFFYSCSMDPLEGKPTSSEPQIKHAKIDTAAIALPLRQETFSPRITPRELLDNFNYCRDHAESDFTCKFFIAKAISDYYSIDDFKNGESYLDFENILDVVNNSGEWEKLGEATDQNVLEKAQVNANNGIPTIAINTSDKYGHVVLIVKGNLSIAHNWKGLMAPSCASFFMVKNMQPFVNKSMGYAYSTPESVYLYTKK